MKRIGIIFLLFVTLSCHQGAKIDRTLQQATAVENGDEREVGLDWLVGNWKRLNDSAGSKTFENWEKVSSSKYVGVGYTLKKGDTVSREAMTLIQSKGAWSLQVKSPEEKQPTVFNMQELSDKQFVVANDVIDFPKKIRYWMSHDTLKAQISNDKMQIMFLFEK